MSDLFAPTRAGSPETSYRAAEAVTPALGIIRSQVEAFARERPQGFIDEELSESFGSEKLSSYRTRRAELVAENRLLDFGRTRKNSGGRDCVVWVHREHHPSPPAIQERQGAPRQAEPGMKAEAEEMARELARYAASFKAEGRMVHERIARAAEIMAALAKSA